MLSIEILYSMALEKGDLRTALQVKALQARIFNYWHSKGIDIEDMSSEEVEKLLKMLGTMELG